MVGIEWGDLRADINDSACLKEVQALGERCEIKNPSSLKLVEEGITAEIERQARILEDGGAVEGKTRGRDVERGDVKRLREKEGGVDYRYMRDPDLGPVVIAPRIMESVTEGFPPLLDEVLEHLKGIDMT